MRRLLPLLTAAAALGLAPGEASAQAMRFMGAQSRPAAPQARVMGSATASSRAMASSRASGFSRAGSIGLAASATQARRPAVVSARPQGGRLPVFVDGRRGTDRGRGVERGRGFRSGPAWVAFAGPSFGGVYGNFAYGAPIGAYGYPGYGSYGYGGGYAPGYGVQDYSTLPGGYGYDYDYGGAAYAAPTPAYAAPEASYGYGYEYGYAGGQAYPAYPSYPYQTYPAYPYQAYPGYPACTCGY